MSQLIYEASVYSRTVSYKNFKGEEKSMELHFALDPLQLLQVISTFQPKKVKSGNPALQGKVEPISDEQRVRFVRDLAAKAAGTPSADGEYWESFPDFPDSLVGKAFLTQMTASDKESQEFAEKVILAPFRAFVEFANADPDNSPADKQQFRQMLAQMESIFKAPDPKQETLEERRARLAAEMAALEQAGSGDVPPSES